jgi:hypothetical protein
MWPSATLPVAFGVSSRFEPRESAPMGDRNCPSVIGVGLAPNQSSERMVGEQRRAGLIAILVHKAAGAD